MSVCFYLDSSTMDAITVLWDLREFVFRPVCVFFLLEHILISPVQLHVRTL